jgi:predicted ferric reductase
MAITRKYRAEVVSIQKPVDNIFVVEFSSSDKPFKYYPGQFLHLSLDEYDPTAAWPLSRCFSMQTSSDKQTIKITFAVKGGYTRRMAEELKKGKVVFLKLPYGELFANEYTEQHCVFIAGGTGITPFLSLFTSAHFSKYLHPILYFGLRNEKYNLYTDALSDAVRLNGRLKVNIIYEDISEQLNIKEIFKESGTQSVYYISGPPMMITTFRKYLLSNGVREINIKTDEWE